LHLSGAKGKGNTPKRKKKTVARIEKGDIFFFRVDCGEDEEIFFLPLWWKSREEGDNSSPVSSA